jgi:hypothetical protein
VSKWSLEGASDVETGFSHSLGFSCPRGTRLLRNAASLRELRAVRRKTAWSWQCKTRQYGLGDRLPAIVWVITIGREPSCRPPGYQQKMEAAPL